MRCQRGSPDSAWTATRKPACPKSRHAWPSAHSAQRDLGLGCGSLELRSRCLAAGRGLTGCDGVSLPVCFVLAKVAVTEHCEKGEWCALPDNFLSAHEAFEFALLRINEMRQKCYGFTLAPVRRQDYMVAGTLRKDMDGYSLYHLRLNSTNQFVPLLAWNVRFLLQPILRRMQQTCGEPRTKVDVEVAHLHRITDLSIFQAREQLLFSRFD